MSENFLSQEEVDDLLKGVTGEEDAEKPVEAKEAVRTYNLATQERIVRGRMPTLEMINERFARGFRTGLYGYIRRGVDITTNQVQVTKYSEFIRNLVVPTSLNLITLRPLRGNGLVVLDPNLVFLCIDSLFGGNGKFHTRVEGRDFTLTEQQIIQRILDIVFETYSKAWEPVHKLAFEFVRSEINTQFVNIATPNEVVVTTSFRVDLGDNAASMHICIPYSVLEPIRDLLSSNLQGEALDQDKRWIRQLTEQIQPAEVELVANFSSLTTSIAGLLELKVGDVLPINKPDSVIAAVNDVPVMECTYGRSNGRYALKVKNLIAAPTFERTTGEEK
jgi:flagellar motor switch protein FliM